MPKRLGGLERGAWAGLRDLVGSRALLDTNVVIRHLTGDPPELAGRASRLLATAEELVLTDLVVAECAFVLESFYRRPRAEVATLLTALLDLPSVQAPSEDVLERCLALYGHGAKLPDAYLVAVAEASGAAVASFDRGLDGIPTEARRLEP